MKISGYLHIIPVIKSVRFTKDKLAIDLADGRSLIIPLSRFPEIEKLSAAQRRKHKLLAGMGLMFDDLDTVFHVSDFIGSSEPAYSEAIYKKHSAVAEPKAKYGKR